MSRFADDGNAGSQPENVDVLVVGMGFAGMYILHCLRRRGLTARAFEAGGDVGGTWYWNRYPGCRVDFDSVQYSYNFSDELTREWEWTEKFAAQPELLAYANHVADRFDLRRDAKFDTRVTSAVFDDETNLWTLHTDRGDVATARYCIMATGSLSTPYRPPYPGIEDFRGEWYHTATWPHEAVDFGGKRVGVIGTGSTGIQAIPVIAEEADHLTVFQRTPQYTTPARNRPMAPDEQREFNARRDEWHDEVYPHLLGHDGLPAAHPDRSRGYARGTPGPARGPLGGGRHARGHADDVQGRPGRPGGQRCRRGLRARQDPRDRQDPEVAEKLLPSRDLPIGSKRVPIDTDYYETFNRDNVTLVDIRSAPIERITARGIATADAEHDLDASCSPPASTP